MNKLWQVAIYEYKRHVLQKRFIWVLVSVPLLLAFMIGLGFLINFIENNDDPVGYVDHAGLLADPLHLPDSSRFSDPVRMIAFENEETARAALDVEEIQAYYVLSPDYYETNSVQLYYNQAPGENAREDFWNFMQLNLLAAHPPEIAQRAEQGANFTIRTLDGVREFGSDDWINFVLPFFAGLAFIILIFTSSGYLMNAVVQEKENRTIEILVTSVSSNRLIAGKVLGIMGVSLTQFLSWAAFGIVAVLLAQFYFELTWLENLKLDSTAILLMVLALIPAYVMVAALMTALGASVAQSQEAQQMTALITLPIMSPYWLAALILQSPNSPLVTALTLFPLTSPTTITMRAALTQIPAWQAVSSVALLILSAAGAMWLAAKAFHLGMLRYGKRLTWKELLGREK